MSRPVSFHKLEEDAYYAVLRALAVNELDWDKEKLLTDLRKVLSITNDQHYQFLEEVEEDKLVIRLREAKNSGAGAGVAQGAAVGRGTWGRLDRSLETPTGRRGGPPQGA